MRQILACDNHLDDEGRPAGGRVEGFGIRIDWQNGPMRTKGPDGVVELGQNGAFVEGVIEAARQRIAHYQATRFACRENALAITKLEEALHWLEHRTRDREERGVEGTHEL